MKHSVEMLARFSDLKSEVSFLLMQETTENNSKNIEPRYASDWLSGLADILEVVAYCVLTIIISTYDASL